MVGCESQIGLGTKNVRFQVLAKVQHYELVKELHIVLWVIEGRRNQRLHNKYRVYTQTQGP